METVRLPLLPGVDEGAAAAVNDAGAAVGSSEALVASTHAVRWSASGAIEDLTPGASLAGAFDVNDRGAAVGRIIFRTGARIGVRWGPGGSPTVLPALVEGVPARPLAINDQGQIAGFSGLGRPSGTVHAVRWSPSGNIRDLEEISDRTSEALGINDRGTVVGQFFDGDGIGAFVWTEAAGMQSLPGDDPFAVAVNDSGQVVGGSAGPAGRTRATLWTADREVVLLETRSGVDESQATDINDRGEVVGIVEIDDRSFPFFWSPEDSSLALLSSRPGQAGGINDSSVVAGSLLPVPFSPVPVLWRVGQERLQVEVTLETDSFTPALAQEFDAVEQTPFDRSDRSRGTVEVRRGGEGVEGAEVTLTARSTGLGGHVGPHEPATKPAGRFVEGGGGTKKLEVTTGDDGRGRFTYQTSGLSGTEAVIARLRGSDTDRDSAEIRIRAEGSPFPPIPEAPILDGVPVYRFKTTQTSHDGQVFFARPTAVDVVVGIMEDFVTDFRSRDQVFEPGDRFVITDANLPLGGLNDADIPEFCGVDERGRSQSCWQSPHQFHRTGRSFDLRTKNMAADLARRLDRLCSRSPETRFCDLEFPRTPSEHLHVETQ